ncbi:MAG: HIT domain-containing protein [Methylocystaceae bacterium]|nr:HIT domain-containing protein [Methylocystaceae bacterium]
MRSAFTELELFIRDQMRMSHIYQPVMLLELLTSKGSASVNQIAKALLSHDASQIEYYEQITKNMVGKVLTKNRQITEREGDGFRLKNFETLTSDEVSALTALCQTKIDEYVGKRGEAIWAHRRKSSGYVPGTARYEILKRAKFRCELCGISAGEKALEVDHILPRNHGGSDEEHNLQALCYSCNATKRDRDDTDFRGMGAAYAGRSEGCAFCELPSERIIAENELALAFRDGFPVTEHHTLIIPKRHVSDFFDLFQPERNAMQALMEQQRALILQIDPTVTAFNVGINAGADAGQTIFHCHMHLIPRRKGDVEEPRGGVRGVIPAKQKY